MLSKISLLSTTTQPHPSASGWKCSWVHWGYPFLPLPISPQLFGCGLNLEICGWGIVRGESCFFLKFSLLLSYITCPAVSCLFPYFVRARYKVILKCSWLHGWHGKVSTVTEVLVGFPILYLFLASSLGKHWTGRKWERGFAKTPTFGVFSFDNPRILLKYFSWLWYVCSSMIENGMCFFVKRRKVGFGLPRT